MKKTALCLALVTLCVLPWGVYAARAGLDSGFNPTGDAFTKDTKMAAFSSYVIHADATVAGFISGKGQIKKTCRARTALMPVLKTLRLAGAAGKAVPEGHRDNYQNSFRPLSSHRLVVFTFS